LDKRKISHKNFYKILGLSEEPLGMFYTNKKPVTGICPKPQTPVSRTAEEQGKIDWDSLSKSFCCVMNKIWVARRKFTTAYFDQEHFGCYGGAFYLGFSKPYLSRIPKAISTGIPGISRGERFVESEEVAKNLLEKLDPPKASARYLVVKPMSFFAQDEKPEIVIIFARPEVISGLNTLALFVTSDFEVLKIPSFGLGCASVIAWPIKYLKQGQFKAVIGSFDPSCRQYVKTDEISFVVPLKLYQRMLDRWQESFLNEKLWNPVKKKIDKSNRIWNESKLA
jgi:uncharacterized protein (DUF169 family)